MVMLLRRIISGQVEEREKDLSASCMYPDEDDNDNADIDDDDDKIMTMMMTIIITRVLPCLIGSAFCHIFSKALTTQMTID